MEPLKTLEEFRRINATYPYTDHVKEWKEAGRRVIGWTCNYVPEEIIYAADMLPIRVTGSTRQLGLQVANSYLYTSSCSYMRTCFELAITDQFNFLDGFVASTVCQGIIRLAEVWAHYLAIPLIYNINAPRKNTVRGLEFYQAELQELRTRLEQLIGREITAQDLSRAIAVHNETRDLLQRLYNLKKTEDPPISGSETMEILNAAVRMPKDIFNTLLRRLLEEVNGSKRSYSNRIRLMMAGSILNNHEFIQGIEDLGALVVVDELCTGVKYCWDKVEDGAMEDPMTAISRRYLRIFPCARMVPPTERIDRIIDLIQEFRVAGVIIQIIRNCAPIVHDQPLLMERLRESGIPVLQLDLEYGEGFTGQIRVRVEAFLEKLFLEV